MQATKFDRYLCLIVQLLLIILSCGFVFLDSRFCSFSGDFLVEEFFGKQKVIDQTENTLSKHATKDS